MKSENAAERKAMTSFINKQHVVCDHYLHMNPYICDSCSLTYAAGLPGLGIRE